MMFAALTGDGIPTGERPLHGNVRSSRITVPLSGGAGYAATEGVERSLPNVS